MWYEYLIFGPDVEVYAVCIGREKQVKVQLCEALGRWRLGLIGGSWT